MADDSEIDPRYAAQFQRGYDGPVPAIPALSPRAIPPSPQLAHGAPAVEAPPSAASPPSAPSPPSIVTSTDSMEADVPAEPQPTPWIEWALLALGVLLLSVAAWIFWQASTDVVYYVGGYSNDEATVRSLRYQLPGPLLVAGVLAVSTWLVLRSARPAMSR